MAEQINDTAIEKVSEFEPAKREQILGIDHILDELDVYIKFLKNFEAIEELGAAISPGILFSGEPGTGKTLCARYIATQSNAHFINIKDYIPKDGLSAEVVKKIFSDAREYVNNDSKKRPVILFWDEIEAHVNKESIVSGLKEELSGVRGRPKGILLVAATNNIGEIDETLLRSGRIKTFHFSAPNRKAKLELLKYYATQYKADPGIDFSSISHIIKASATPTDIEEAVNSAWNTVCINAIAEETGNPVLTQDILIEGLLEELMGPPDNTVLPEESLREIDIYFAGRALVARTLGHPVQVVAFPRVGYDEAVFVEEFDGYPFTPIELVKERIVVHCAGKKAHKIFDINPNTQGEKDFENATLQAQQIIERLNYTMEGVSLLGLAKGRSQVGIPPAAGINSRKIHETVGAIKKLVENSEEEAQCILEYYGEETILALVELLNSQGYIVQADIDEHVVPYEKIKKGNTPSSPPSDEHHSTGQYL